MSNVTSVMLLIQSKTSGLNKITNSGWAKDDSLAYRLANHSAKEDQVSHVQIVRIFEDDTATSEAIKGDDSVSVWSVALSENGNKVCRQWECLASDGDEAIRLAEEANPSLNAINAYEASMSDISL